MPTPEGLETTTFTTARQVSGLTDVDTHVYICIYIFVPCDAVGGGLKRRIEQALDGLREEEGAPIAGQASGSAYPVPLLHPLNCKAV